MRYNKVAACGNGFVNYSFGTVERAKRGGNFHIPVAGEELAVVVAFLKCGGGNAFEVIEQVSEFHAVKITSHNRVWQFLGEDSE
jgi:hypothetical protein